MNTWRWIAWYPVSGKSAEEHLAGLEKSYTTLLRPDLPLKALIVLTHKREVELTVEQVQRIAACLAQEKVGTWGWGLAPTGEDGTMSSLLYYRKVMLDAGHRAVEPMRWLLGQPPAGAAPLMDMRYLGRMSSSRTQARIRVDREWPIRGAKLIAMEVLEAHGDGSELPSYLALAADPKEDRWTRCEAGLAALRVAGEQVAEQVEASIIEPFLPAAGDGDGCQDLADLLARSGGLLVRWIVPHLEDEQQSHRDGAAALLKAIGQPAVPALVSLIETSGNLTAMEQAAVILAKVAPAEFRKHTHRLAAARERYELETRGLSRAAAPGADAERGLSRGEAP